MHTMNYVVADGKSNWLEGIILVGESWLGITRMDVPLSHPQVCMSSLRRRSGSIQVRRHFAKVMIIQCGLTPYPGSNFSTNLAVCSTSKW